MTTPDDAVAMIEAGADAVGLNFYPRSKRFLAPEAAANVRQAIGPNASAVGLYVNADVIEVVSSARRLTLDWIQLHGDESPDYLVKLKGLIDLPVIKAFRCAAGWREDLLEFLSQCAVRNCTPAAILVDGFQPDSYGGTGQAADWAALADWRDQFPIERLILAGGLDAENVAAAISQVDPSAVDTASGVEIEPGKKNNALAKQFCENARAAMKA
ncbi:MAG: hypothetical protein ACIALR_09000 [Blastopirellula sp. JB062]